eukprot:TRINITY_DN33457_c0_g1_i2.p1 TRINITY_DN33457_c0_g1~~TRINITY_DN33457_c0_g1_i2.p1  ORF type:complete len:363 (-),score=84.37 TRINITY_DN33457_c0_g1_i2:118-1167(-)
MAVMVDRVTQPQFEGGGPTVLVRNTFLDVESPPSPTALLRAKTAPAASPLVAAERESDDKVPREEALCREVTESCYEESQGAERPVPEADPWYQDWSWTQKEVAPMAAQTCVSDVGLGLGQSPMQMVLMPVAMAPLGAGIYPEFAGASGALIAGGAMKPSLSETAQRSMETVVIHSPGGVPCVPGMPSVPQPQTLTRSYSVQSGFFRVHWTVDGRKLKSNDKQTVSPPFELSFGSQFPSVTFKMMIYPQAVAEGKGGCCFKKSKGRGYVQLKCEAELAEAIAKVLFRISIGNGDFMKAPRGPVEHDFALSAVCGLDEHEAIWDFMEVVEQDSLTFVVCLEIVPSVLSKK